MPILRKQAILAIVSAAALLACGEGAGPAQPRPAPAILRWRTTDIFSNLASDLNSLGGPFILSSAPLRRTDIGDAAILPIQLAGGGVSVYDLTYNGDMRTVVVRAPDGSALPAGSTVGLAIVRTR